jgi:hypothetical protein
MSKIAITYEKNTYELEYNRNAVRMMEGQGFNIDTLTTQPVTMIPLLFYGAFSKNHTGIKRNLVDKIYDSLSNKQGLIAALVEMYAETVNTLMEGSPETEGNAVWEVVK